METDAIRLAWETPAAVPLTDTESRADQPDIALRNIVALSPH